MDKIKTYLCYDAQKQAREAATLLTLLASLPALEMIPFERSAKKWPDAVAKADLYVLVLGKATKPKKALHRPQLEAIAATKKPLIGVNTNGMRGLDSEALPALLKNRGLFVVTANSEALTHALQSWPAYWQDHDLTEAKGVFRFTNEYYDRLKENEDAD